MIDLLLAALVEASRDDWVNQPSRSAHASIIRTASIIPEVWRPWAACILDRESGGTLDRPYSGAGARNPTSSAQGRWQFLDTAWRINGGLHHMVVKRLKAHGMPDWSAAQVRRYLRDTPIAEWPAPYQDIGFIAVILSGGQHHWNGPGCSGLAPR